MHLASSYPSESVHRSTNRQRKSLALDRIAATRRQRIRGPRGPSRLVVTGIVVSLGAASFVVASAADIPPAPSLCSASNATITGTAGNDVLVGTAGNDIIWGGGGGDVISGLGGNDRLCGSTGNDRLYGGSGNDYLDGGSGTDVLKGNSGQSDTCLNGEQRSGCEFVGITTPPTTAPPTSPPTTAAPPTTPTTPSTTAPPTGRFGTLPVGATMPSDQQCAASVRRMTENRPENAAPNAVKGNSPHDDIPRVTGNFVGTTDEILQWAACKWGIDEDLVRAQIAVESWWLMSTNGDNGESWGLGQVRVPYHQKAFENQNAKLSSAYNVDYTYAVWRACFEGQYTWLNTVERGAEYRSGDAMGCTGVWFSGRWRTPAAIQYIAKVDDYLRTRVWTTASFGPSTPGGPPTTPAPTTPTTPAPTTPTTPAPTTPAPTTPTTPAPTTPTTPPPTTTAPSGNTFVETFDGSPATPTGFLASDWSVAVHTKDHWVGSQFDLPVQADHGPNCEAPPTTHQVSRFDQAVFNCKDHIMTALNADSYGAIYLTPAALVDFSTGPATVSLDVSTNRKSGRDWWDLWITPTNNYLQLPLQSWLPDLHGPPANAIHVVMDFEQSLFKVYVFRNGSEEELTIRAQPYTQFLTPDAARRDNFQLTISNNHLKFGMPGYGQFWADEGISNLSWTKGIVQFGHHSYSPTKAFTPNNPAANTWHIDNFRVSPAVPFEMSHANLRDVNAGAATVTLDTPSPAGHLSFSALGSGLQVRYNDGAWQAAQMNPQTSGGDESFRSYWTPIPAGVTKIEFRGTNWWAASWRVRDITVFGV